MELPQPHSLPEALAAKAERPEAVPAAEVRPRTAAREAFHVKHGRAGSGDPAGQSRSSFEPSSAASRSTRVRSSRLSDSSSQVASTPSSAIATMSSQR
jgi:hypothetical protein